MAKCRYCKEDAGFLRWSHAACREAYREALPRIDALMRGEAGLSPEAAGAALAHAAQNGRVHGKRLTRALARSWNAIVKEALAGGGVFSREEEARLDALLARFDITRDQIDRDGLWRKVVAARRRLAERRIVEIVQACVDRIMHPGAEAEADAAQETLEQAEARAKEIAALEQFEGGALRRVIGKGWVTQLDRALADNLLSVEEERGLVQTARHFGLDPEPVGEGDDYMRLLKAGTLRDLTEGKIPGRVNFSNLHHFRLQKSETMIWLFQNVSYSKLRKRREFQGRSAGMSVRVAKGVYFRTGGFKGYPVEYEEMTYEDTGVLGITTKHIYFGGSRKRFRIRHDRIVSIEPYSDGVGVQRDGVRAMPELFEMRDGWFIYNLLSNIQLP